MNNDLISRSALMKKINEMPLYWKYEKAVSYIHDIIKLSPAVDAVEVVRCKDCVRCGFCGDATNLEVMGFYGYCSRGERKGDD